MYYQANPIFCSNSLESHNFMSILWTTTLIFKCIPIKLQQKKTRHTSIKTRNFYFHSHFSFVCVKRKGWSQTHLWYTFPFDLRKIVTNNMKIGDNCNNFTRQYWHLFCLVLLCHCHKTSQISILSLRTDPRSEMSMHFIYLPWASFFSSVFFGRLYGFYYTLNRKTNTWERKEERKYASQKEWRRKEYERKQLRKNEIWIAKEEANGDNERN